MVEGLEEVEMAREPETAAEIMDAVEQGTIGHRRAMEALHLESFDALVETMHLNGRTFWAHRATRPSAENKAALRLACGLAESENANSRAETR
jgi:hypothetical protein